MTNPTKSSRVWLIAIALGVLAALPYLQTWRHQFINFDDNHYVTENWVVMFGVTWRGLGWSFVTLQLANWHPLTWISHMMDVQLWNMWAGGHHLTSVLFHSANTMLVFLVFRSMTGAIWRSAMVAAIFGLHPLHVESVAWVSERKDVLSTFFGLLAIGAYVRYTRIATVRRYIMLLIAFAMSLMAKPMLVTLPFVLMLFDIWPLKRWRFWTVIDTKNLQDGTRPPASIARLFFEKLPLVLMSIASCVITVIAQSKTGTVSSLAGLPISERISNAIMAYQGYLAKLVCPVNLSFFYPLKPNPQSVAVLIAGVVLVVLTILALVRRRQNPWMLIGWLFFLGTLVPVVGIVQVGLQAMADRYMYVPLIGIALAAVWSVPIGRKTWHRRAAAIACVALCGPMFAATWRQTSIWRDNPTLYQHALAVDNANFMALQNLGGHYESLGELDRAIGLYEQSLAINPRHVLGRESLGNALIRKGQFEAALEQFKHASDRSSSAYNSIGIVMMAMRRYNDAEDAFRKSVELQPYNYEGRGNLGAALLRLQKWNAAVEQFRIVLEAFPLRHGVRVNLARALAGMGQKDDAIIELRRVLQVDPNHASAKQVLSEMIQPVAEPAAGP